MISTQIQNNHNQMVVFDMFYLLLMHIHRLLHISPIKSTSKPQRFITALILKFLDDGHPIKNSFAPHDHEFVGKVERMNRTVQDKISCEFKISVIKSKKYGSLPYQMP